MFSDICANRYRQIEKFKIFRNSIIYQFYWKINKWLSLSICNFETCGWLHIQQYLIYTESVDIYSVCLCVYLMEKAI